MTAHQQLAQALDELEATLKASNLWRVEKPSAADFASHQPFCVDTMSLPQWLRFVFIQRLQTLVEAKAPMPAKCEVAPAIAAYLQQEKIRASDQVLVVRAVERVDQLVTQN
ncbi:YqcC family protein [Halomonas llamarensis]|uniref:YqcC family protein n=1 Tax=Halomonas llamarensis TaxID=2945104 RepID=A0ABT0SSQ9_9GAMM|nr:YqcC family protein [Halomonas llamarensis]MCL7930530.1 YqcC family protein [Halomonas llamarensis]